MADLVLSVDVTSLADARKKLDGFQKAMNGLSVNQLASGVANLQGKIRQLVEAQAKGNIGASAYNKGLLELKRAYEQLGYSSQQATAAVRQYAAQLQRQRAAQEAARAAEELARAQAQAAARTRELRLRFQEGYATFDRARKQMRDLREAMRQGIITTDQYREAVRRLREEQRRAAAGAGDLARRMNRTGVITQQAGYQIGDFIVQVQSGTNFLVAFGQQATQVAGTLTLLGGKWILIGSVLGVTIPLITAAGAAFMRARGQGQTLEQTVTKLTEISSQLKENFSLLADEDLDQTFGNMAKSVSLLTQSMLELNAASELKNLTSTIESLEGQANAGFGRQMLQGLINIANFIDPFADMVGPEQLNEQFFERLGFQMARSQYLAYVEEMRSLAEAGNREGVLNVFERFIQDATDAGAAVGEVSSEGAVLANQMYRAMLAIAEGNALLNGSAQAARDAAEAEREREQAAREAQRQAERTAQFVAEQLASLALQERLYLEMAKYGEDSLQVERERSLQARIAYENELKRQQVGQELIPTLMQQYDAMVRAREEADRVNAALDQVESANLSSFNDQVRMLATLLGTSADEAARLLSNMPVGMTFGNTGALSGYSGEELLPPARRQPRGGASGPNAVERLQQEIAFRQRILNLSQEERDLQTEIFRITNALGKDRNKYSSDFIANLAQQNLAIQEQERVIEDARKQQEQLADSIANSFGDAFMSMVDGTKSAKDAFRSMAADIIRELYRVLVVQRMVNSISGALGPGGSAGGFLSRLIGGRESGGSMMAGRPYIVGERGPELVIPGRSSTVTNADLTRKSMGGSDAVNVVNNINVTGGTDPAAIRQEVAKLMPQITNATKSAVIDARRRGGQMKAAFG